MKFVSLERYSAKPIIVFFAFWDKTDKADTVVITTHGLIKKTDKIPKGEIARAEKSREKYFNDKNKEK